MQDRFEFSLNNRFPEHFRLKHPLAREFVSEFAATFLFLLVGVGCVIQLNTSKGEADSLLSLNLCWGFVVTFVCGLGIGVSGGHMNPAITFAQFLLGKKSFIQFLVYPPAQILGAFVGTAVAYWNYEEAINSIDGGHRVATGETGSLCYLISWKASYESHGYGLLDQIIGTGILACIMASGLDKKNGIPKFLHPLFAGFSVMMIGMSFGVNDNYPINPARDFGARLFALFIYGWEALSNDNYWFWVPIVGPMLGCVIGVLFYSFLIDCQKPKVSTENEILEEIKYIVY